ncbi:MAG TPA: glycosyltransferase family 2 protein [Roseimicrobium sp.]|nr:glycosyltransferase family 2 protein [Roseimicrobium sp.]
MTEYACILFWGGLLVLGFTFLGYPLVLSVFARISQRPPAISSGSVPVPKVSIVLVVRNESDRIESRIANLLESNFPADSLRVLVVSDGSTDATVEKALKYGDCRVEVEVIEQGSGKSTGLNRGLARAIDEIVVFADARQRFTPDTIPMLVKPLMDRSFGACSGRLIIESAASSTGSGVGDYWALESRLRSDEAKLDSCIGCTGAVYAIRRECFSPIPEDTLLDDVLIPMQVVLAGKRVWYEPDAMAFDPQSLEPARESVRKERTLAGNFQLLFRYPGWLLPWRNRLWWALICHKYLRLLGVPLMGLILVSNLLLLSKGVYQMLFAGQACFYLFAVLGLLGVSKNRLFSLPASFVFLNWMTVRGLIHYLTADPKSGWKTVPKQAHP